MKKTPFHLCAIALIIFMHISSNCNADVPTLDLQINSPVESTSALKDCQFQDELNCFAIIAGCQTTTDGSVLMGHNEDDSGEQMLNMYVVPANAQAGTCKYLWAEFPGMSVCDSYMNEYGVCVASDGCTSCEDRDDFTDGGVLYEVRQTVAKHATSARHAVHLIGDMVEKYGYRGSGRTYVIADPKEGWICSIVKGRHWVAQRVPDDKVMCIPNYYTITQVNLEDTLNFLGCRDIETYAIERGWYNPQRDGVFNFRLAYHAPSTFTRESNAWRHEPVINYITDNQYNYSIEGVEPMFTPAHKMNVQDIINMLSIHRDRGENVHPHNVCTNVTILSSVFQLRSWLPREIGCVMWNCPSRPCTEVFVPWYLGMEQTPEDWHRFATAQEAEQKHFTDSQDKRLHYPDAACWYYVDRWNDVTTDYNHHSIERTRVKAKVQQQLFKQEEQMTKRLQHMPKSQRSQAQLDFTRKCLQLSQK